MSPLPRNTRPALACALALACSTALAQQHDHAAMQIQDMPGMEMSGMQHDQKAPAAKPQDSKADTHAAHPGAPLPMDHSQHQPVGKHAAAKAKTSAPASDTKATPATQAAAAPEASHAMPAGMAMDMNMPDGMQMDPADHAAHAHSAAAPTPLPEPTAEARAAAFPELGGMDMSLHMDDDPSSAVLRGDRLEHVQGGGTAWDARFGVGGNFDKLWLRGEGEQDRRGQAQGNVELQWSHATGPWWDRVVSLRSDFGPGPSRQWAGVGVMGLAPYKFELQAHAYVGQHGRLAARIEGEYELLLTNKLILTPRVELNAYGKADPANRIGQGLSQGEAGLRLRYEFTRQFAPYLGYAWTRSFGDTAELARANDEAVLDHAWVAGLRFWF